MQFPLRLPRLRRLLGIVAATSIAVLLVASPAMAHAELRQSSPEAGETVGGAVHSIALQFFGLDLSETQQANVSDAAGNELASQLNQDGEQLVIALVDPIKTPGEYLVTYAVSGIDGDFTVESFTFQWQEGAPAPKGITVDLTAPVGFDTTSFVLLLIGAALSAFLVHRVLIARREHRAAQSAGMG